MCGVCGICFSPRLKQQSATQIFSLLLKENKKRGKDSTGIVYLNKKNAEIYRGFLAGNFVGDLLFPRKTTRGFFGHVRYATIGSKTDIRNVHPFETENIVGAHNGTIFNYKWLKRHFNLVTTSDCDSEVIFRLIDQEGVDALKYVIGTFTIVYYYKDKPTEVYALTNGAKPLEFLFYENKFIAWASVADATFSLLDEYYEKRKSKNPIQYLEAIPGILYKMSGAKLDVVKELDIKIMTEKEGALRYKVDFKILNRDFYMETVPLCRRLPAGKRNSPVQSKSHTPFASSYTAQPYSRLSITEEKTITPELSPKYRWLVTTTLQTAETIMQKAIVGNPVTLYYPVELLGTITHYVNGQPVVTPHEFQIELLFSLLPYVKTVQLYSVGNHRGSAKEFLASALLYNKIHALARDAVAKTIQSRLIDLGILKPNILSKTEAKDRITRVLLQHDTNTLVVHSTQLASTLKTQFVDTLFRMVKTNGILKPSYQSTIYTWYGMYSALFKYIKGTQPQYTDKECFQATIEELRNQSVLFRIVATLGIADVALEKLTKNPNLDCQTTKKKYRKQCIERMVNAVLLKNDISDLPKFINKVYKLTQTTRQPAEKLESRIALFNRIFSEGTISNDFSYLLYYLDYVDLCIYREESKLRTEYEVAPGVGLMGSLFRFANLRDNTLVVSGVLNVLLDRMHVKRAFVRGEDCTSFGVLSI